MSKKLYVGNLSYTTTESQLREHFSKAGDIASIALITDRETGRPKGFGFIEMTTDEGAKEAIKRFNGFSLDNRALTVNEARPREERSSSSSMSGFGNYRNNSDRNR